MSRKFQSIPSINGCLTSYKWMITRGSPLRKPPNLVFRNAVRQTSHPMAVPRPSWLTSEATDILLDTSTNDGLNLIPFNFYAAHSQALASHKIGLANDFVFFYEMYIYIYICFYFRSNKKLNGFTFGRCSSLFLDVFGTKAVLSHEKYLHLIPWYTPRWAG